MFAKNLKSSTKFLPAHRGPKISVSSTLVALALHLCNLQTCAQCQYATNPPCCECRGSPACIRYVPWLAAARAPMLPPCAPTTLYDTSPLPSCVNASAWASWAPCTIGPPLRRVERAAARRRAVSAIAHTFTRRPGWRRAVPVPSFTRARAHHGAQALTRRRRADRRHHHAASRVPSGRAWACPSRLSRGPRRRK